MTVQDPSGQTWRVSRRWLPWRRRLRGVDGAMPAGSWDLPGGDDPVSMVLGALTLLFVIPLLALVLLAGLEALLLVLVLPFAVLARVLLGRHWVVEVRRGWRPWWAAETGDWRACQLRIHEIADAIRRGDLPPETIPE